MAQEMRRPSRNAERERERFQGKAWTNIAQGKLEGNMNSGECAGPSTPNPML